MAELKTKVNNASVDKFLQGIGDEKKRQDCHQILKIMKKATKADPKMWGTSIIGFGDYHYKYESGRENDWFLTGFSPRVQNLTLYMLGASWPDAFYVHQSGPSSTIEPAGCDFGQSRWTKNETVDKILSSEFAW